MLVRIDKYKPLLAMHYSGPFKVIEKHSKYYVISNSRHVPVDVSIDRLKRFVERRSSNSTKGDELQVDQEPSTFPSSNTSAKFNKTASSRLNPEAQPWLPHSSKGRLRRPTKRLICEM